MFIGRKLELQTLKDKLESDSFEVGVIYGQRRIGKTSLIREAINGKDYVYFLARDAGIQENLNELNKVLNKYFNLLLLTNLNRSAMRLISIANYPKTRRY